MAHWEKHLPHNFKDLSSNPQKSCKKSDMVVHVFNPHADMVKWEMDTPLKLHGPPSLPYATTKEKKIIEIVSQTR